MNNFINQKKSYWALTRWGGFEQWTVSLRCRLFILKIFLLYLNFCKENVQQTENVIKQTRLFVNYVVFHIKGDFFPFLITSLFFISPCVCLPIWLFIYVFIFCLFVFVSVCISLYLFCFMDSSSLFIFTSFILILF